MNTIKHVKYNKRGKNGADMNHKVNNWIADAVQIAFTQYRKFLKRGRDVAAETQMLAAVAQVLSVQNEKTQTSVAMRELKFSAEFVDAEATLGLDVFYEVNVLVGHVLAGDVAVGTGFWKW